jgi:ATP-dependent DNA helicase RecQ
LREWENCAEYELLENYRSKANIVNFANNFAKNITKRMKSNPIEAVQKENGKIKIVECESKNVTWSVVSDVIDTLKTPLIGSTCVLAFSNDEVCEIAGMLSKRGNAVKIIQLDEYFNLYNILEVRCFYDNLGENAVISDDIWKEAKQKLNNKFKNTKGLEITKNIIREFEQSNPQIKYKTDFEDFISESELEDFFGENSTNTIFVSTMHKAKGKEFDNVFIMLKNYYASTDEKKRLFYVALTRAKNLLHIHFHGSNIFKGQEIIYNNQPYPPVNIIPMFLTLHDVYLNHFKYKQKEIGKLNGNENLQIGDLFKFSEGFKGKIEKLKNRGYEIKEIIVNFIVYWKGEDMSEEIKIILPCVEFVKS